MFTQFKRQLTNNWIEYLNWIQMNQFKSLYVWFLITQRFKKFTFDLQSSRSCTYFAFSASFAYLMPFQKRLYDGEIYFFTPWTSEGHIHNYYSRCKWQMFTDAQESKHHSLRATGCNFVFCFFNRMVTINCYFIWSSSIFIYTSY